MRGSDGGVCWEMQYRFIDDALRLIDRFVGNPPVSRFHCFTKVKPRRHREHGENPAKKASVNSVTPW
jgi:hypothetical protein